ncbi:MAG: Shedu anti-phage system protein SduA domain-containing protein [Clostridium baratii]
MFPEFQLGTEYKADYLLIGKNSGGYEFIFVELENPNGNITKKNGNIGEAFRKGIDQTKDWKRWLEKNYQSLREVFKKHMKERDNLPNEFIEYDSTRFHYVVIAGRIKNFNELTYQIKREYMREQNILLMHYDNLVDQSKGIIGESTY